MKIYVGRYYSVKNSGYKIIQITEVGLKKFRFKIIRSKYNYGTYNYGYNISWPNEEIKDLKSICILEIR